MKSYLVDKDGYYGEFGGAYIPEILHKCVEELTNTYLPDGVVYFMGSRMIEVLSFQVYFTSIFFREAACQIEWGRTAHIITQ